MNLQELRSALLAANFKALIGETEGISFDAKEQPYRFGAGADQRREFAKDICAFANVDGGCIVMGLKTEIDRFVSAEKVSGIRAFPVSMFDADQYAKVLREWVYPVPSGIEFKFVASEDPERGLGMIFIPPQDRRAQPFLITRSITEAGRTSEILIGLVERTYDRTDVRTAVEIHHALRTGLNLERELLGRIEAMELSIRDLLKVSQLTTVNPATGPEQQRKTREALDKSIRTLLAHPQFADKGSFALGAAPGIAARLDSIFVDTPDSIRRKIERPAQLRPNGWGVGTSSYAQIEAGRSIGVQDFRRALSLSRDGILTFASTIDRESLAWSDTKDSRIHPLALIETIDSFTRLFAAVVREIGVAGFPIMLELVVTRLHRNTEVATLPSGPVSREPWFGFADPKPAPENEWTTTIEIVSENYDPDRVAFLLVADLYHWFGHFDDAIPYTRGNGAERAVDSESIATIR